MSVRQYIALTVCCLQCIGAAAQSWADGPLKVCSTTSTTLEVAFAPSAEPSLIGGTLRWEGLPSGVGPVGYPDLPLASTVIRLPRGSKLTLAEVVGDERIAHQAIDPGTPLPPVAGPWIKDSPRPLPCHHKAAYTADSLARGGSLVQVDSLGAIGRWQYFRLMVRPLAYNPVRGDLAYYPHLTLRFALHPTAETAALEDVPPRYLIVSRPRFREGLQPFVQWKRQMGFEVVEHYANTQQCDSVRDLIQPLFTDATALAPAPEYLLLVGDTAELQPFPGLNHPSEMDHHPTDLPYARFGSALLPSAYIGRWPVGDTAELGTVVRKTLAYEQGHSLDTAALRRVLLVAGYEGTSPAPTTTNGQVNYLKHELTLANPSLDTLCHYNPDSRDQIHTIATEIGQGVGLLNYTAHCTQSGWTSPAVTLSTLDSLPSHMPLLYVNNCCKSNDFSGDCFGEQLLRMPAGGAIGVIGATNNTLWIEDYLWAIGPKFPATLEPTYQAGSEGAFDRWAGRSPDIETQGELLAAGNMAVTAYGSLYGSFYWETYCLLGDPALRPFLGIPEQATVTLIDEARNGQCQLRLQGTPFATVAALQDSLLLGTVRLDSLGRGLLHTRQSLEARPLVLTISGRNLLPSVDTIQVLATTPRGVALREVNVTNGTVHCIVENIGLQHLENLNITLSQSSSDSLQSALIEVQTTVINSLPPGARQSITLPLRISSIGSYPLLLATLTASSDSVQATVPVRCDLPDERPTLTLRLHHSDGSEAHRLMPATTYTLCADISGQYDSLRLSVLDLSTDSTCLTFTTPTPLCSLAVKTILYRDAWHSERNHWLVPGDRIESFEDGFASHPWDTACRMPWFIDSTVHHSGQFSARSGAISHGQASDLAISVFLPHDDTVSFWVKVSSEPQHDILVFLVDGERMQPVLWGDWSWHQYRYRLSAGHHTLCWRYQKDHSTSRGSDCAWVDDISLPLVYWDMPAGWQCVDSTLGVPPSEFTSELLEVYPNPASEVVTFRAAETMTISVVDATGRQVTQLQLLPNTPYRWVSKGLQLGVYFAQGQGLHGVSCKKIIIMNE